MLTAPDGAGLHAIPITWRTLNVFVRALILLQLRTSVIRTFPESPTVLGRCVLSACTASDWTEVIDSSAGQAEIERGHVNPKP